MPIAEAALEGAREEAKAWLRVTLAEEDALIDRLVRGAIGHAEDYLGQMLIARDTEALIRADRAWVRLPRGPVRAVTAVAGIGADGGALVLPPASHAVDIDGLCDGWVRMTGPSRAVRLKVTYRAGLAETWAELPDVIRQGVVRIVADHHAQRAGEAGQPSPAVATLWRPWRRMRVG